MEEIKNINQDLINQKEGKILGFKANLSSTDYQIIKRSEAYQNGLQMPYPNIIQLRNSWREEINKLEEEIKLLNN